MNTFRFEEERLILNDWIACKVVPSNFMRAIPWTDCVSEVRAQSVALGPNRMVRLRSKLVGIRIAKLHCPSPALIAILPDTYSEAAAGSGCNNERRLSTSSQQFRLSKHLLLIGDETRHFALEMSKPFRQPRLFIAPLSIRQ